MSFLKWFKDNVFDWSAEPLSRSTCPAEHENETEEKVGFEDETAFMDFLGLGWVEPSQRVAGWNASRKE